MQVLPSTSTHQGEASVCRQTVWCHDVNCFIIASSSRNGNYYRKLCVEDDGGLRLTDSEYWIEIVVNLCFNFV